MRVDILMPVCLDSKLTVWIPYSAAHSSRPINTVECI